MMSNEISTETIGQRVQFLAYEWSLIAGWLLSLGLIWRQTLFYGIYMGIGFGWGNRAVFIGMLMITMCVAVFVLTMMGAWLKRRRATQTLFVRWLIGLAWVIAFASTGYGIIIYLGGTFNP